MSRPGLTLDRVSLSFGGLHAVSDFSLALGPGELQGLIGPNGAGKTTVFNLITGVYRPDAGDIRLGGRSLVGLPPHKIAAAGVARTFQNIRLFGELSVLDNVRVACHLRAGHGLAATLLRLPHALGEERAIAERAHALLAEFGLDARRDELARNLAYGDQRRLEVARALATGPEVLLLDEPAAGMNSAEKLALAGLIRGLRDRRGSRGNRGLALLLIDHDVGLIMGVCERITVLDHGQTIAAGTAAQVQSDPKVIEAYLGEPVETV